MIPAIDFHIFTNNSTLRGNLSLLLPGDRDVRVLNKEYKLRVIDFGMEAGEFGYPVGSPLLSGSIKCHDKKDVLIVLNNLKNLLDVNTDKVEKGSYLDIHYCGHFPDEGLPVKRCTTERFWANNGISF